MVMSDDALADADGPREMPVDQSGASARQRDALATFSADAASLADAAGPRPGTVGLALGGGAARGLAHIPLLEALDEMGVRPNVVAGTSIGSLIGAVYASGMRGQDIRAYALELFEARSELVRRFMSRSTRSLTDLFSFTSPALAGAEALFSFVLPEDLPERFEDLKIPLRVVATDFHAQDEVILETGPLMPAISASSALPGLLTPVRHLDRILIDGGFVNPTPFDIIRETSAITIAADVTGKAERTSDRLPRTTETWIGAAQIMLHSLVTEKLKHQAPDIFIRPPIAEFGVLDFYKIEAILKAAEPAKDVLKRRLDEKLAPLTVEI